MITGSRLIVLNQICTGAAYIAGEEDGIVSINKTTPVIREVCALEQDTKKLVQSRWSWADGTYLLPNLNPNKQYIVLALDHTGDYPAVVEDMIRPYVVGSE